MDYSANGDNCLLPPASCLLPILIFPPGDLERLRRFWMTGTCNPKKEENMKRSSEPLAPEQVSIMPLSSR